MSLSLASLLENHPQRIVGIVVAFGGSKDIGERLADMESSN